MIDQERSETLRRYRNQERLWLDEINTRRRRLYELRKLIALLEQPKEPGEKR